MCFGVVLFCLGSPGSQMLPGEFQLPTNDDETLNLFKHFFKFSETSASPSFSAIRVVLLARTLLTGNAKTTMVSIL